MNNFDQYREDMACGYEDDGRELIPIEQPEYTPAELAAIEGDIPLEEEECSECGHALSFHDDPYGCQVERGDAWVDGVSMGAWVAQGPCGCKHWRQPDANLEQLVASAYAAYLQRHT